MPGLWERERATGCSPLSWEAKLIPWARLKFQQGWPSFEAEREKGCGCQRTIAGKVPEIQSGRRNLRHGSGRTSVWMDSEEGRGKRRLVTEELRCNGRTVGRGQIRKMAVMGGRALRALFFPGEWAGPDPQVNAFCKC